MNSQSAAGSNFDLRPINTVATTTDDIDQGWDAIARRLSGHLQGKPQVIAVECYPGVDSSHILGELRRRLPLARCIDAAQATWGRKHLDAMLEPYVTDDRVFGRYYPGPMSDFFEPGKLRALGEDLRGSGGHCLIAGPGASLLCQPDVLILADLPRWEIEQRQRAGAPNWLSDNGDEEPLRKFKRGYFIEWRVADRHKRELLPAIDYLLDTVDNAQPKLLAGPVFRRALSQLCRRPFRVVPCFDPGPWGGQWLREVCDLPSGPPNYAWSFDCIIEANSLLLGVAGAVVEVPALDLVLHDPVALLGEAVHRHFGAEFPIRFNFLDTMYGGNLSLQVHPLPQYLREVFGFPYPQDESYYVMAAEEDACVYLGLREGVAEKDFLPALRDAQQNGGPLDTGRFINRWPAQKHDHFLIPAGTVHCSGRNTVVLEISSTPYIFTFKLWDWGRLGLDGKPRPVHIEHGKHSIRYERDTAWTRRELINRITPVDAGDGWRQERTGLHELEFIETRRHWFTSPVVHPAESSFQVVNLCQGRQVTVDSPEGAFPELEIHYAETFVVPAAAGRFRISPAADPRGEMATIKAFVRSDYLREGEES